MKKTTIALSISLALNISLIGTEWFVLNRHRQPTRSVPASANTVPMRPAQSSDTNQGMARFDWSQLESTDYRTYIANLREIRCPEETVQDIILAEISKLYAPRIAAAQRRPTMKRHYWQPQPPWSPNSFAALNEIFKEKKAVLRELLGIDLDESSRMNDGASHDPDDPLAFLSDSRKTQFRALQDKYRELEARIYADAHAIITAEDRAALATLQQQKASEMNALLTPEERFEYGLRDSPTARKLQQDLEAFQPTEAEFRAIYRAQVAFYDKPQPSSAAPTDEHSAQNARANADAEFETQLKAALGNQRYVEYQLSKDPGYQTLLKVADRFGLPDSVATQVLDLKQTAELQKQQVLSNPDLDPSQRQAWLQSLHDQVGTTLVSVLGDKGFSAYHDYAGAWVDRLGK